MQRIDSRVARSTWIVPRDVRSEERRRRSWQWKLTVESLRFHQSQRYVSKETVSARNISVDFKDTHNFFVIAFCLDLFLFAVLTVREAKNK